MSHYVHDDINTIGLLTQSGTESVSHYMTTDFFWKQQRFPVLFFCPTQEAIKSVDKYVFKKEAFDLDFFKIYLEERKYNTYLFVSDRFKKIMEENNVTGLALEKVYSI